MVDVANGWFGPHAGAGSSLYKVYIGCALSMLCIYLVKDKKYYGQIYGQLLGGLLICIYWMKLIKPYCNLVFKKSYFKYIFTYSVPLIPYALSGVIIEQFGKLAIGKSQSLSEAGFYSLALAVSSLVSIIIAVTHQAWNPYYFEYMNSKNYKQLDIDFVRIFKITILGAFGIAAFGKEIGLILAKKEFSSSLYLIPIFTLGYVFYQFSYAYLRNFGYSKNTYYMTITVLLSGASNVVLNFILIKHYGAIGAAISFVLSYIIMALIGWFINHFLVKLHATPMKYMLLPIGVVLPFYFLLYLIMDIDSLYFSLFIKLILCGLLATITFWTDRIMVSNFIRKILIKKVE